MTVMIGAFTDEEEAKFPENGETGIVSYEKLIGQKVAAIMWFISWEDAFPAADCEIAGRHGSLPMVTWELFWPSVDPNHSRLCDESETGLDDVLQGKYNDYIDQFAEDAKKWGKRVLVRFLHEFNGGWYTWGGKKNGGENGGAEKIKKAWIYVVDRVRKAKAENIEWVWCAHGPAIDVPLDSWNAIRLYWPGEEYVDWLAIDGYNWYPKDPWGKERPYQSFDDCFLKPYQEMLALSKKPIILAEMSSGEFLYKNKGKAEWIEDAFLKMKTAYTSVQMFIWFNKNKELDWRVNSSEKALNSFRKAILNSLSID
jgi:beta-mannanase